MSGPITFGSLFAGIGGLDLGLERAGMVCRWQVEKDAYAQAVLAKHWPSVPKYEDVKDVGSTNLEPVDLICGGFPCQDISYAGKGAGLSGERSGLWYEFARVIGEMGPKYVVVENVAALFTRGIDAVLGTLADLGYDAEWDVVSAADMGAPHLRKRIFIIAYAVSERCSTGTTVRLSETAIPHGACLRAGNANGRSEFQSGVTGRGADVAHSDINARVSRGVGLAGLVPRGRNADRGSVGSNDVAHPQEQSFGTGLRADQSRGQRRGRFGNGGCTHDVANANSERGRGGSPGSIDAIDARQSSGHSQFGQWDVEPDVGRVAHGVSSRVDRLRGLGNAVVPQVAEFIGRRIVERFATDRVQAGAA